VDRMNAGHTVGEVARLAHISVRTLHHYDEIGLLTPSGRTPAGYRLYDDADLQRLQQILFYRELEFGLDAIAAMIADPGRTAEDHLRQQHHLLRNQIGRSQELLRAIEKEMEARAMGFALTPEEQFEVFGTDKVGGEWAQEAEHRWGETDAYRESQRRTAAYTKQDWARMKAESDTQLRAMRDVLLAGVAPDSAEAMALAEQHRQFLNRWFYDCGYDMHRNLADMYVADERFTKTFEDVAPGLAQYVHDAIFANAASR
jgi:MerR family transcriptional regulator, thiopeptide resistance regulator